MTAKMDILDADPEKTNAIVSTKAFEQSADAEIERVRTMEVTSVEEYDAAEKVYTDLVYRQRDWDGRWRQTIANAHKTHKDALAAFKQLDDRFELAKKMIQGARSRFLARQAEARRIVAEQIAEDQRAATAAAVAAQKAAATAALVAGDVEKAERILTVPVAVPQAEQAVATLPAAPFKNVVQPWKFEITDEDAVPRKFCSSDSKKIRKLVDALGGDAQAQLTGVRVYQDDPLGRITVKR